MNAKKCKALRANLKHHPSNPVKYTQAKGGSKWRTAPSFVVLDPSCTRSKYQLIKRHADHG